MAQNNNNFWLKLMVSVGIVLIAAAVAYGILNQKVTYNCKTIETHQKKIETCEKALIEQGSDIKHIKGAVDRIEKKL